MVLSWSNYGVTHFCLSRASAWIMLLCAGTMNTPCKSTGLPAAIYARISWEDQSRYSLPSQREGCEALAAAQGYQTSAEFTFVDDGGLSTELDRPALAALREAVRMGMVRAVAIHSLDRLSRKVV